MGKLKLKSRHRLVCGDSTDKAVIDRLMGDDKADMVFTDPPYGLNWSGGTWASNPIYERAKEWDVLLKQNQVDSILRLSPNIILWGGNYYTMPPSRCWLSWRKSNKLTTMSDFELAWTSFDKPCKEFVAARNSEGKRQHPTQKPIALAEWCFENYGNPKTVLDLFGGSGSTLIACEKTNRRCFMSEIDPYYCQVIIDRWEKYSGKTAIKE